MYPYLVKNIGIFNARKLTTGNTRWERNVDVLSFRIWAVMYSLRACFVKYYFDIFLYVTYENKLSKIHTLHGVLYSYHKNSYLLIQSILFLLQVLFQLSNFQQQQLCPRTISIKCDVICAHLVCTVHLSRI
jgi:hypothetical protein